jgi:hypothetical protein
VERRVGAFLDEIASWASEQTDVQAVVLVGSQARVNTPAHRDFSVLPADVANAPPQTRS